jgi:2-(1,2-epoxy-1,2-dihydrophenyl)acetyl-CoA isomerase
MSGENVEVVRRVLDGFSRSDRASVEPLLDADVEWRTVLGPLLGVEAVSGRDPVLRFGFEEIPDAIQDARVEVEELSDLGEGRVLLVGRYLGRGKSSGIDVDVRIASIHRLRAGMIVSVRDYASREEALEAAGLRE